MPGRKVIAILLALLLIVLMPVGCGKKQSASQKPQSSAAQKPKAPGVAEDILKDINTIIDELNRKVKLQNVPELTQTSQGGGEGSKGGGEQSQSSQGGGDSQGEGGQSQQGQKGEQQSSPGEGGGGQESTTDKWQKEKQSLKKLHRNWNSLEPQAAEAGLPENLREGFKQALNSLTLAISKQNPEESLMAAVDLYGQYGELTQVYTMPQPREFYQVQYGVMAAMAAAERKEWSAASISITEIEDPWAMLLPRISKQDKMLAQRTDFSLRDLQDAINSEEINLAALKSEIVLNNLKTLGGKLSQSQ